MTLKTKLESVFGDSDERAVSPVIGVILMVAITVILAAVIATFVLDLGGEQDNAPQVSFSYDYTAGTPNQLVITHSGGDTFDATNVQIKSATVDTAWATTGQISAGGSKTVNPAAGETVRLIYDTGEGNTKVIGTFEVPA